MKKLFEKWNSISLVLRIFVGLVLAVILALITPKLTFLGTLGDLFVGALKAIAPILVFVLVTSSLAQAQGGIGKRFTTVIILYMLSTTLAAIMAVFGSFLFPVTLRLDTEKIVDMEASGSLGEVLSSMLTNIVDNPLHAIINANYIGILFWAIIIGLLMKKMASDNTKQVVSDFAEIISKAVQGIIGFAPFGIFGLVYRSISTEGMSIFADYAKLLALLVGCMLINALVINPLIVAVVLRRNPYPLLFRCLRGSAITAFFTRSSAANIPVNMELCKKLNLDPDMYSVSIPLGATINMDGAAATITVMSLAAAHTVGVEVTLPTAIILSIVATLSACGASGVAGGSLLLIPLACSLLGIGSDIAMQVVSVGFIIGVIQDSVETALNSSGDVLFTATAEFYEWRKQGREIKF